MNTLRKSFLIGLTVLGLGTASLATQAQEGPRTDAGMQQEKGAKFGERMAKHRAMLHDKLKLTAAQEPAWKTFIAATTPAMRPERPDHAAMTKLTAPERMEKWIAMSKERVAKQETGLAALKTFYGVLTAEQKKVFDDNVPGGEHGPMRGHRMHMMK